MMVIDSRLYRSLILIEYGFSAFEFEKYNLSQISTR